MAATEEQRDKGAQWRSSLKAASKPLVSTARGACSSSAYGGPALSSPAHFPRVKILRAPAA